MREAREQVRGYARRTEERVHEWADTATQAVDKGHEFLKDKQAVVTEAVEAGRKAMQREHEWLPGVKKA